MWYASTYWKAQRAWQACMHPHFLGKKKCVLIKIELWPFRHVGFQFPFQFDLVDKIWVMILMKNRFFFMLECSSVFLKLCNSGLTHGCHSCTQSACQNPFLILFGKNERREVNYVKSFMCCPLKSALVWDLKQGNRGTHTLTDIYFL